MRSARAIAAAAALMAVVTMSGCASDDKQPKLPRPSVTIASALAPENFGSLVGAAMLKSGSTHAVLTAEVGKQTLRAEGDFVLRQAGNLVDATVDFGVDKSDKAKVRLIDAVLYLNLGAASGDKFVGVPFPPGKKYEIAAPYVRILGELDPVAKIKLFAAAPGSVTQSLDPVTIDGIVARSFVLTVGSGKQESTLTAYVGPDNLPRRVTSQSGGGKVTIDYSKWGGEVDVVAPPSNELAGQD